MDQTYRIFTDGSAIGNPGPGGWGVVLTQGKERWEMSGARSLDDHLRDGTGGGGSGASVDAGPRTD